MKKLLGVPLIAVVLLVIDSKHGGCVLLRSHTVSKLPARLLQSG